MRLILLGIGFRFGRIKMQTMIFERRDIGILRRKYLERVKKYRDENAFLIYSDETWYFDFLFNLHK
jgi:hypothetical protein